MKFIALTSDQDGEEGFDIEADNRMEALEKALSELGWYVIETDEEDEEDEEDQI
jgi:hypothetical protein